MVEIERRILTEDGDGRGRATATVQRHRLLELGDARWHPPRYVEVPEEIEQEVGHPLVARLLVARGHDTVEAVRRFLDPGSGTRTDPSALPGVAAAVERLAHAVERKERLLVWGDFDADGQTATALLVLALRRLGLDPAWHVPLRQRDSHGLNASAVDRAVAAGASLVLTCDCGVSDRDSILALKAAGIDTIVTDHHAIPFSDQPHPALALVSPRLLPEEHPARWLSGVGVAYYLASGLLGRFGKNGNELLDLVALGTIADVAPLVGENRRLVWRGLPRLNAGRRPGIAALLEIAKRGGADPFDAAPAGWTLGPRLNAFGRLDDATVAVELLLCDDSAVATRIAETADKLNRERIEMTDQVVAEAAELIENAVFLDGTWPESLELRDGAVVSDGAIVVAREGWPAGVVGLAASRLVERYLRPVAMVAWQDGLARVSMRSAAWCDLTPVVDAVQADAEIGFRGGSHSMAAGGSLPAENLGLFALAMAREAQRQRAAESLCHEWTIDAEIGLHEVTLSACVQLSRLAPFGNGNREPLFLIRDVALAEPPRLIGQDDRHAMLTLVDARGLRARAVWWGGSANEIPPGRLDALARIERNDYGDSSFPRLVVVGVRPVTC
jgi:single-stranded-DNA-specific exonuclease